MDDLFINQTHHFARRFLELASLIPDSTPQTKREELNQSIFVANGEREQALVPPYMLEPGSWWWGNDT